MLVRDAVPDDADAIRTVHRRSIESLGPQTYDDEQVAAWAAGCASADYAAAIESAQLTYVVAAIDGEVVGFGSLNWDAPHGYAADADAEVTAVYVEPSVALRGVGTRIYEELEARARADGVGTLGLTASRNAVPFSEAHGYERVRERGHEFSAGESTGVTGTVVEMGKRL